MEAKAYGKKLIFPLSWLVLMNVIISLHLIPPFYADYFFCLYFGGFFIYFTFIKKEFSLWEWFENARQSAFWKWVGLTLIGMAILYGIGYLPRLLFPNADIDFMTFPVKRAYDIPTTIAFIFAGLLFPAMGQELFYRKTMICFDSKKALILSTIAGCLLFGINDNLNLFGIIQSGLLGLGFSLPYIKTKNIYIPITAHYIASIVLQLVSMLF